MTKIVLITTGGTIASRTDAASGDKIANLTGASLRAMLHDKLDGIDLVVDEFSNIGSYAIDLPLAFALAQRIASHTAAKACAGVVVTHGTDTMEETAFLADLIVATDKPVVFTGAQRSADMPDADGPRNIADAVRLAASEQGRGLGTVICFEQDFHAARDVTKTHTSRVDAFASGEHGKLGEVDETHVVVFRRPLLRASYNPARIETRIDLIKLTMGMDDRLLRHAAASGAKAVVLEAFGRGNATPAITQAVGEIVARGIPVVVTSRCPQGRTRPIYGGGGGADLDRAGAIFAGDLSGPKTRILLAVLLGLGLTGGALRNEIARLAG